MTQTKKNFVYNVVYQFLILFLPLITVPYISRVLGSKGVGIYSYTYSITYYFILISMLGINNYGNRTIARVKSNKEMLSRNFWGIYAIQFFMTILMLFFYCIYIYFFSVENMKLAFIIQGLHVISVFFDFNWFFWGLENFKITVGRNVIVKILSLIGIFVFVKESSDINLYLLIMSGSVFVAQIMLVPFLKKELVKVNLTFKDIKKHIKPCIYMFIPVVAISIYKVMDKIMLGNMSTINAVGYYEQAEKIINIPLGIITALGVVMLPKISNLVANNKNDEVESYIDKSIKFMMFLAFPICCGLVLVAPNIVNILLGKEFICSIEIIKYLSITIIFISFANVIRTQYLIPKEKDKIYIVSVILGAILNFSMNYILIPKFNILGACIGTIFAELIVMLYQIYKVRKELPIFKYVKSCISFAIKARINVLYRFLFQ